MTNNEEIGCVGNTILTRSGKYFDFNDPKPEQVCIEDIAFGLSNNCRFAGQVAFYSVAEHSVACYAEAIKRDPRDFEFHKAALMHDASEAYLLDIPKPLKIMIPGYSEIEKRVEDVIFEVFNVSRQYKTAVKEIDLALLKAERKELFRENHELNMWTGLENIDEIKMRVHHYSPERAYYRFRMACDQIDQNIR